MSAVINLCCFTYQHSGEAIPGLPAPKPCPFCGESRAVTIDWHGIGFHGDCDQCGAEGPLGRTPLEAAQLWNRRPGLRQQSLLEEAHP